MPIIRPPAAPGATVGVSRLMPRTPHTSVQIPSLWWFWLPVAVPGLLTGSYLLSPATFHTWLWSEQGPLELSHVLIPMTAMGIGVLTLAAPGRLARCQEAGVIRIVAVMLGLTLMCGLVAGEEASWGQHLVGWQTPESWGELNDQNETNLHNVSSWADQKPRLLVELGAIISAIVLPLAALRGRTPLPEPWRFLVLPLCCLPVALLAEISHALEKVPDRAGAVVWAAFPRLSELQEFYYYLLFALCMVAWRQQLLTALAPEPIAGRIAAPAHAQRQAA